VLIVGAGLFARSLARLNGINLGIDPERTILVVLVPRVRTRTRTDGSDDPSRRPVRGSCRR
jgi:hypothetical protein